MSVEQLLIGFIAGLVGRDIWSLLISKGDEGGECRHKSGKDRKGR